MITVTADASFPVHFISCGNLVSDDGFLHINRTLDEFIFILMLEGTLSIHANEHDYVLGSGEFLFLLPGMLHYGTVPSDGRISYYWTHFTFSQDSFSMTSTDSASLSTQLSCMSTDSSQFYLLPECGKLSDNGRTNLLFVQLLDIAKRSSFRANFQCSYALSTMLLELSGEIRLKNSILEQSGPIQPRMADLMEWLKLNYDSPLSVADIAKRFGYHPAYLTALFKKTTGYTVVEYIHLQRIRAATNLLLTPPRLTISEISETVGFSDEKYFMKLFKRYEGMTPTAYRNAFSKKGLNRK